MNVLSVLDLRDSLNDVLRLAADLKRSPTPQALSGKTLGMIFEKPSTRTRISFEVAMTQLGGHAIYLSPQNMQLGRGETIADTAKVLSRFVDAIVYRAFSHETMLELARHATVPVINALDDREHPCQIVADLLTIQEQRGFDGTLAYIGDGNNVCNSLLLGAALAGIEMVVACPPGYEPDPEIYDQAKKIGNVEIVTDPHQAARGADVLYTDVWVSMGDEEQEAERTNAFRSYRIDSSLVGVASPDVIVMHPLPAHRGKEITDEVIDGPHSVVWDQAENRLHVQKAILTKLMSG